MERKYKKAHAEDQGGAQKKLADGATARPWPGGARRSNEVFLYRQATHIEGSG